MGVDNILDDLMNKASGGTVPTTPPVGLKDPQPPKEDTSPFEKRSPNEVDNHRSGTIAPTNEGTHDKLQESLNKLSPDKQDFITMVDQYYGMTGTVPTRDIAVQHLYFTGEQFDGFFYDDEIQAAMVERGIISRVKTLVKGKVSSDGLTADAEFEPDIAWKKGVLTPLQLLVANTMVDLIDTRSQKKKLQDYGIDTKTYNKWLADPTFSGYMRDVAERMVGNFTHEAHLALMDKVRMGDLNAIKYIHEMNGRFVESKSTGTGGAQIGDVKTLMVKILEILQEEITDPDTLVRIGERFQQMSNVNNTANQMVSQLEDEIVVPHIADRRVLSQKLQDQLDIKREN